MNTTKTETESETEAATHQPTTTMLVTPVTQPSSGFNLMSINRPAPPGWEVFYDGKEFWCPTLAGMWTSINLYMLQIQYVVNQWMLPPSQQGSFPNFLCSVQGANSVNFAGSLGGHKCGLVTQGSTRILVTSEPSFIQPQAGNWDMLRGILERMLGVDQLPFFYGWLKIALLMFTSQKWMAGQVLALTGSPGAGKNLIGFILGKIFGGRTAGKPYAFMAGKTTFNSDYMGCEFLTIDDEVSLTNFQARRDFGSQIKDLAVNEYRWLHRKNAVAQQVSVFQRLLITLNDQPERLLILPPIESDIEDKIMLMKVECHPMPMPTTSPDEREAFGKALVRELPAFVDFLQNWTIPAHLVASRYGISHYHHPELLEALNELSPEERLRDMIDEVIFAPMLGRASWKGKAKELERALKGASSLDIQREAKELLPATNSCGKLLGRLADRFPERFKKLPGRAGSHMWEIKRGTVEYQDDVRMPEEYSYTEGASGKSLEERQEMTERIRQLIQRVL